MTEIKFMPLKEFQDLGLLGEINRQWLHPIGLALAVEVDEHTGDVTFAGIWDGRDDLEGIRFADGLLDEDHIEKARAIEDDRLRREYARRKVLGYAVQPLEVT